MAEDEQKAVERSGAVVSTTQLVVATAFRMHEEGRLSKDELMCIVKRCINATAMDNGYAETHGLPFPEESPLKMRRRRT